jgi:hypothetical protein
MEKKQCDRRRTQRQVEQLQIEEYMATNRHGPGDHTFTLLPKVDEIEVDKPTD